jgi:hypothetical protein
LQQQAWVQLQLLGRVLLMQPVQPVALQLQAWVLPVSPWETQPAAVEASSGTRAA